MEEVRVRFAPSPTGFAHIGNIRTALFDWLLRQHAGGSFILRVEDTDRTRIVEGAIEEIYESLRWLGTLPDEGPETGGPFGPYTQSERLDYYKRYADQLIEQGDAYYCFCTADRLAEMRKEKEARKESTGYDRFCLSLSPDEVASRRAAGECAVVRYKVPDEGETTFHDLVRGDITFENRLLDDFVIIKSDGYPTYHFACVVDDHLMEITHVIRAEDWISSTPKHELMYKSLGWEPPKWAHPSLLLGTDRSKLSKRHGAVRFLDYRESGFLPEAMINFVTLLGWSPGEDREIFSVEDLIERFSIEGMVNHPAIFDFQKAEWMNGVYIRSADLDRITDLCVPYLQAAELVSADPGADELAYVHQVVGLEQERMKVLSEIVELADFFFQEEPEYEEKGWKKHLGADYVPGLLTALARRLEGLSDWNIAAIDEAVREVGESMDVSGGKVIHPVRMAVTGRTVGPGLFETMDVLGRERVVFRLRRTVDMLAEVVVD